MTISEKSSQAGLILSKIIGVPWATYGPQLEEVACRWINSEALVRRSAGGRCTLTTKGEEIIDSQLRERIVSIRGRNPQIDNKELILELGIEGFVEQALSREKPVPPEVMIGTVLTYLKT